MIRHLSGLGSILLIVGLFASLAWTQDKPKTAPTKDDPQAPSVWMKNKLEFSKQILSGISTGDFDEIATSARAMRGLGKIEGFVRARTPGYKSHLEVFLTANDELIRQAEKESVEGAALAFTQMTISCVNCHKHLREHDKK